MKAKILSLLCVLFSVGGFAHMDSAQSKVYVTPDQIAMHENQIWANLGHGWVTAQTLSSDTAGFYVSGVYFDPDDITPGIWKCAYCGFPNPLSSPKCKNTDCVTRK